MLLPISFFYSFERGVILVVFYEIPFNDSDYGRGVLLVIMFFLSFRCFLKDTLGRIGTIKRCFFFPLFE